MQNIKKLPVSRDDICAVITTYLPDIGFPARMQLVQRQVGCVVIVDDSGLGDSVALLKSWFSETEKIILYHHSENLGIAASLNHGISIARQNGYNWVLTLDDDTLIDSDMVVNLIDAWRALESRGGKPLAIIGMAYRDSNTGIVEQCVAQKRIFVEKRGIITSGSLLSLNAYDQIGPFREEFFIDSVDYDFCLRARAKGFRVVKVGRVGMTHTLGQQTIHHILGFKLETTNHAAVRRYYLFRNASVLAREHFMRDPLDALAVIKAQWKTLTLVLLFEQDRCRKLRMMWRGVRDAWRRRMGKCAWNE